MIKANPENSKFKKIADNATDEIKLNLIKLIKHLDLPKQRTEKLIREINHPDTQIDSSSLDLFLRTLLNGVKVQDNPVLKQIYEKHIRHNTEPSNQRKPK